MTDGNILSLITFLPIVGALIILVTRGDEASVARNARYVALWTTSITFLVSLYIWWKFDPTTADFQFVQETEWLGGAINYHMGVDGISMLFVILTTFLMPACILASWTSIEKRVKEYMIAFLVLETLMIGVFCALDLVLFYLFFEGGLIPMFLIIGIFTAKDVKKASQSQTCMSAGKSCARSTGMLVVPASQYIAMMARSMSTEPAKV